MTIQYIHLVQICSMIISISSLVKNGLIIGIVCVLVQHITNYAGIGYHFKSIRISIVNAAYLCFNSNHIVVYLQRNRQCSYY